jgi:hypothetical protein
VTHAAIVIAGFPLVSEVADLMTASAEGLLTLPGLTVNASLSVGGIDHRLALPDSRRLVGGVREASRKAGAGPGGAYYARACARRREGWSSR